MGVKQLCEWKMEKDCGEKPVAVNGRIENM